MSANPPLLPVKTARLAGESPFQLRSDLVDECHASVRRILTADETRHDDLISKETFAEIMQCCYFASFLINEGDFFPFSIVVVPSDGVWKGKYPVSDGSPVQRNSLERLLEDFRPFANAHPFGPDIVAKMAPAFDWATRAIVVSVADGSVLVSGTCSLLSNRFSDRCLRLISSRPGFLWAIVCRTVICFMSPKIIVINPCHMSPVRSAPVRQVSLPRSLLVQL